MLHIVLVEDNDPEAYLIQKALRATGLPIEIVRHADGGQAIDHLKLGTVECDLILLDLNLPRISGFEVLERLRAEEEFRTLPVVILSGSSDAVDVERAYRSGANSYVRKPVHIEEIFEMAEQLLAYWARCVMLPPRPVRAVLPERR